MRRPILAVCTLVVSLGAVVARGGQPPDVGTITGRVRLTARVKAAALPSTAYPTRAVGVHDNSPAAQPLRNVVVYLKDFVYRAALAPSRAALRQEHETFVPHVLAITRGSTVDFPNDDPIFHNVFSLSSAATFDLRRYPQGEIRSQQFNKAGVVKIYCHIHSHMSAVVLVLDHPYFVTPQDDGSFELPKVPPGDYTIVGWHERIGERRVAVHVERGKAASVQLTLPVEDAP
jgi:plastocyanin